MRLGSQQQLVGLGGFTPTIRAPTELGAVGSLALAEQQVIRFALDPLAGIEAKRSGAWAHQRPGGSPPVSLAWM